MKNLISLMLVLVLFTGCIKIGGTKQRKVDCPEGNCPTTKPVTYTPKAATYGSYIHVPYEWREPNNSGSCFNSSVQTVLRIQGRHDVAADRQWRGGASLDAIIQRLNSKGLDFSWSSGGGAKTEKFIRDCCDLRLGCAIGLTSRHVQTCVGYGKDCYYVIDNNGDRRVETWTRRDFLNQWQGFAVTVVEMSDPPIPR